MPPAFLTNFARFYNTNFDRRPIPTLIITNGVLNTLADALAQTSTILLHKPTPLDPTPSYDPERTLRFAIYGMALGPLIGKWMRLLERSIPIRAGANGNGLQLAKRVLADQAVMAPFGLALFITSMGIMEGRDSQGIKDKFSDMYFPALIANWKVWPLIQTINFKLMPLQYRVPFQSTCGIAWTLYLSLLNAKDDKNLEPKV
ncbi:hypothetical protein CI109_104917 [Kwoniella shandongensis]|uniref:Uncharacterized protein n=1 Tax=Kwoniella shandongensis TaxID=1734106 RepID=A0A5M6BR73_9TREE|nr:uncharacterized protein CI109_006297 [Kwoniella shandongensis]KAA5525398.1 hypothetical protein CI109_006297 [Kwoniella shandongensis]